MSYHGYGILKCLYVLEIFENLAYRLFGNPNEYVSMKVRVYLQISACFLIFSDSSKCLSIMYQINAEIDFVVMYCTINIQTCFIQTTMYVMLFTQIHGD